MKNMRFYADKYITGNAGITYCIYDEWRGDCDRFITLCLDNMPPRSCTGFDVVELLFRKRNNKEHGRWKEPSVSVCGHKLPCFWSLYQSVWMPLDGCCCCCFCCSIVIKKWTKGRKLTKRQEDGRSRTMTDEKVILLFFLKKWCRRFRSYFSGFGAFALFSQKHNFRGGGRG